MASKEITATGFASVTKDITGGYRAAVPLRVRVSPCVVAAATDQTLGCCSDGGRDRSDALSGSHELHLPASRRTCGDGCADEAFRTR